MNRPLDIQPSQVNSQPSPDNKPGSGINPTTSTPGFDFSTNKPQINVTFDIPTTLVVVYLPTDRPNEQTSAKQFTVTFVYPNGTKSQPFPSVTPSSSGTTTTPSTGAPSETSTTTPFESGFVPPSVNSPQVKLPPNFQVPNGTIAVIDVTETTNNSPATGVRIILRGDQTNGWLDFLPYKTYCSRSHQRKKPFCHTPLIERASESSRWHRYCKNRSEISIIGDHIRSVFHTEHKDQPD